MRTFAALIFSNCAIRFESVQEHRIVEAGDVGDGAAPEPARERSAEVEPCRDSVTPVETLFSAHSLGWKGEPHGGLSGRAEMDDEERPHAGHAVHH